MTIEKQNIAIYKLLGFKPNKFWRYWTDKEKTCGPLCIESREKALEGIEREKNTWYFKDYADDYLFSEPEEYDDWSRLPPVNLDLLHLAEKKAYDDSPAGFSFSYNEYLTQVASKSHDPLEYNWNWHANVSQRRETLLKTLNLWEE